MADKYPAGITTKFTLGNFGRTINPFSKIFGNDQPQYVPKFLIDSSKSLSKDKDWTSNKAAKMAHVFTKVLGAGVAAGGLFALLRLGAHTIDMDKINMAGKTAGQDLQKQYSKPVAALMTPPKKHPGVQDQNLQKSAAMDPYASTLATLPPIAALLAAGIAFKKADQYADRKEQEELNNNIANTLKDINTIGISNVKKVRGVTDQKGKSVKKQASQRIPAAASFLALLLSGAGIAAGYHVQRAYDPATIKYKALKKGLQEYAKARSLQGLQQTEPIDRKLLASLNPQKKSGKAAVDQLPQVNTEAMYRPVDI